MIRKTALIVLFLVSAISGFPQKISHSESRNINRTNKIEIRFLKGGDNYVYNTADKNHLFFFKDLLKKSKNNITLKCDSTVEIVYLVDNKQLFKVYFSSQMSGSSLKGSAISYTLDDRKVLSLPTYNVGMMIEEIYYQRGKKSK